MGKKGNWREIRDLLPVTYYLLPDIRLTDRQKFTRAITSKDWPSTNQVYLYCIYMKYSGS
ncbi:hypothetical protein [Microcoleus sp. LEGE 07076]|uniref:hypothetical protein n=1 Tax=Microcoleus sp. LEGE 07076 TaxID=915322 RepID=UPI00187EE804|nr:hypothetical protein [Microcoleus sp. LEGE 07076]